MMAISTTQEATHRLLALNGVIATAVLLIEAEAETLRQFFAEADSMNSIGAILDPTLFMKPERREAEALLSPVYRAALDLVETYGRQCARINEPPPVNLLTEMQARGLR